MHLSPQISLSSLLPFLRASETQGVNTEFLLSQHGLHYDDFKPQRRIDELSRQKIISQLFDGTDDPDLGLRSSNHLCMGHFDLNGYISNNCRNPLEAIKITAELHPLISDRKVLTVKENADELVVSWEIEGHVEQERAIVEHLMASYIQYGRHFLSFSCPPLSAQFRHTKPRRIETLQLYEEIFQCPLYFNQDCYAVTLDMAQTRDSFIPQACTQLKDTLMQQAKARIHDIQKHPEFTYLVRTLLHDSLSHQPPSRQHIAEQLNMSSRTMQRRLLSEGNSFNQVYKSLRMELAEKYLEDSTLNLDDIAEKLCFSETRSFHRSFKQWTGITASQYREENRRKTVHK